MDRVPISLKYAEGFEVSQTGDIINILVRSVTGDNFSYALIPNGSDAEVDPEVTQIVEVPVKNLVATSTSHLPFLDLLNASESLAGFPNTDYVSSNSIRARIDSGWVKEVGHDNGLDFESLVELKPDVVTSYISGPDRSELDRLRRIGIPSVVILDFMESSPLGRAEWIKFIGYLLGKQQLADSVFNTIEQQYLQLKIASAKVNFKPSVFSGTIYGDIWFAPGGDSFVSTFIEDAGGLYTWKHYQQAGSIELSFESVLNRNLESDFWIGCGGFSAKKDLISADARYANFQVFGQDRIYNYHGRIGATGGFEYLEAGGARPDLVLADFVWILHPELMPNYEPYFFKKLD